MLGRIGPTSLVIMGRMPFEWQCAIAVCHQDIVVNGNAVCVHLHNETCRELPQQLRLSYATSGPRPGR